MEKTPDELIQEYITEQSKALIKRLSQKIPNSQDKYDYYNADNDMRDFGISVPKKMMNVRPGIGWASRAVNTLADRVVFDGFANDRMGMNDTFDEINAKTILNKAKHDAFIAGCAFVAIGDDNGRKVLIPFTATEATGVLDVNTGLLKYGLAVTDWGVMGKGQGLSPKSYIVFTPEYTATFIDRTLYDVTKNPTKRTLLHPITRRASADRPLGKSRITNTVRRIIQEVARVKRRYEIAGEFYSTPQRYINGLAQGEEPKTDLDSAIGKIWLMGAGSDGEKADIGQLAQMTINQFSDNKKDLARDFCAETALTLRNLGYETGNPTSAESLSAMSDDLLLEAKAAQVEMGEQIKQIAITLRMALDGNDTVPSGLKELVPAWQPIFQVDVGAAGDAIYKLFQAMPELMGTTAAYQMLGLSIRDAEKLQADRQNNQANFMREQ